MKKKNKNLLLATGLVVTSALVLGACSSDDTNKEDVETNTDVKTDAKEVDNKNKENKETSEKQVDEKAVEGTDSSEVKETDKSADSGKETSDKVTNDKEVAKTTTKEVKVYKPDEQAEKLVEEEATIVLNEDTPPEAKDLEVINNLVFLSNPMQGDVFLETLFIDGKVLKLNFGESITEVQGSTGGLMFMDSITQTIFKNFEPEVIESVMFVYGDGKTDVLDHVTVNEEIKRK